MRTLLPLLILGAVASEAFAEPRVLTDGEMDAITAGAGHQEALNLAVLWAGIPGVVLSGLPVVEIDGLPRLDLSGRLGGDIGGLLGVDLSRWPVGEIAGLQGTDTLRGHLVMSTAVHQANGSSSHTTVTIYQRATSGTWNEVTTYSINNSVNK